MYEGFTAEQTALEEIKSKVNFYLRIVGMIKDSKYIYLRTASKATKFSQNSSQFCEKCL